MFIFNASQAQVYSSRKNSYNNFIKDETTIASKYFLIQATSSQEIFLINNTESLTTVRQLSNTDFIVLINNEKDKWLFKNIVAVNNNWKLSDGLLQKFSINKKIFIHTFLITVYDKNSFIKNAVGKNIKYVVTEAENTFIVFAQAKNILATLLQNEVVIFIAEYHQHPTEELQINNLDVSVNKINVLHNNFPLLKGNGLTLSIKENRLDTNDIDFAGRYVNNSLAPTAVSDHATTMATMAAGAGNSYYLGRGVADGATISSSNYANLLPDAAAYYTQQNITVQNHSYGVGVENFYGADAAAFDAAALSNDKLLFVFSAGNSGTATPATGNYLGIAGNANLTGSFKMAKNIITVGATDSFYKVETLSSKGPAYDGRIKPEMVAYGEDGSSGAAALVSGTAIILQDVYKNNNAGAVPASALVKSVLLNSCDDAGVPEIDYEAGFGSLNAINAVEDMLAQKYFIGTVANAGSQIFNVMVPPNTHSAKFMLVWNDLPAAANVFKAIKNDLDIEVKTNTGTVYLPWVLNSFAHKDSLLLPAQRKKDSINTVEQVTINNPSAGIYTITVKGYNVSNPTQPFALAYHYDSTDNIKWVFPAATDNIFPAMANVIRWSSTFNNSNANIFYTINNGTTWLPIAANINTSAGFYRWKAPDTCSTAKLKITVGVQNFISNEFTICSKPEVSIGFNCDDSVLLQWNKIKGVSTYKIYELGNKYLQALTVVSDTQYIFNRNISTKKIFAVAAFVNDKEAVKSYATDYTKQGIGCYTKSIIADKINNNDALIVLNLSSTYLVNKIIFQKLVSAGFAAIQTVNTINGLLYTVIDANLQKGINIYRAVIFLTSGKIIYTENVSVTGFDESGFLLYPNPVASLGTVTIQFNSITQRYIKINDAAGKLILQKNINSNAFSFEANFASGVYILSVTDAETKKILHHKFVVL